MRRLPRATIPPPSCPSSFSRRGAAVQVASTYQSRPDTKFSIQVKSNFKDRLNYLDNILLDFDVKRVKNFEKLKEQRRELVKTIEEHICAAGNARLIPVGSLVTGLVFDVASDLDLCLFAENKSFYNDLVRNESFRIFVFKQMQSLTYELGTLNPVASLINVGRPTFELERRTLGRDCPFLCEIMHLKGETCMDMLTRRIENVQKKRSTCDV